MLNVCSVKTEQLDFTFNTDESIAVRIGPRYKHVYALLSRFGLSRADCVPIAHGSSL